MSSSILLGLGFTLSGLALLMGQILIQDLYNAYNNFSLAFNETLGEEWKVFPDYQPET